MATQPDRLVHFEQAPNFRDLGGYASRFGGMVRWGRVYRAAALHDMTAADRRRFDDLGVRTVYDLRSAMEYTESPDPVPSINLPLLGRYMAENAQPDFPSFVSHDHGVAFMTGMCLNMINWGAPELGQILTAIADEDRLPLVFHCTAGKDRTGVVAAVLLDVLGVDREDILDDFELTNLYRPAGEDTPAFQRMLEHGMPPEAAAGALGAPRPMMAAVLDEIEHRYGGVERYLIDTAGLSTETIDRLRVQLLDRA
jgi:protein-tyrosine phosphatase